jgi:PQQ-dependent catabolism-associated CXXCW motif protein
MGDIPSSTEAFFRKRLASATQNDFSHPLIVYCHEHCWLSWNAAKRAISYGYRAVYWFPDGVEGWKAAGEATATVEPEKPRDSPES